MEITAQHKYARITPRKARLIASSVKHLPLELALTTLGQLHKRAGYYIKKTIESGIANAENNAKLSRERLFIKKLMIDEGPRFKRWRAASRGMAHPYAKNTCHITVILDEIKDEDLLVINKKQTAKKTQKDIVKQEKKK